VFEEGLCAIELVRTLNTKILTLMFFGSEQMLLLYQSTCSFGSQS